MTRHSHTVRMTTAMIVLAVAGAALAVHGYATWRYRASFSDQPLDVRKAHASAAAAIEPVNTTFELRYIRLNAESLYDRELYREAHDLMQPYAATAFYRDDQDFLGFYRTVNRAWADEDAAKAHRQHGHEGPGGTLDPDDIER